MTEVRPIDSIVADGRHRKDLGDLTDLAESIAAVQLLHPIVVTPDSRLVAGQRRLEACRLLGWTEIPVTVANSLTEAAELARAQADENTCRLDMKPSEKVAMGMVLETLERSRAQVRQETSRAKPGERVGAGKLPEPTESRPQTRDIVGAAVGMSGTTYHRAKRVVQSAQDEDLPPEVREVAAVALRKMDESGEVTTKAYLDLVRALNPNPPKHNGKPPAKPKTKTYSGRKVIEGVRKTVGMLVGLASGLDGVSVTDAEPEPDEALVWEKELASVMSSIRRFRTQIKEYGDEKR